MEDKTLDTQHIGTRDFIKTISEILEDYKEPLPRFTKREALFLTELLLHKSNDLILFTIADFLADNHHEGVRVFANGASYRRLEFFKQFWVTKGNATKSAINCGYSPKSAKQQGHRLLRWIQRNMGQDIRLSGFKGSQK
jgi:hypothetical protein